MVFLHVFMVGTHAFTSHFQQISLLRFVGQVILQGKAALLICLRQVAATMKVETDVTTKC